jgi:hypothetical protein
MEIIYIYIYSIMETISYKTQIITFIVMVVIGMLFNPMNMLAFRLSHLYISFVFLFVMICGVKIF